MLISIIIPVYNVSAYLAQCVQSVLTQTYQNLEIVLVNDGSMDDSGAQCEKLAKEDHRIRVVHQENKGLSGARNTGLLNASGEYILFLDADDYYADNEVISKLSMALTEWDFPDVLLFCRVDYYESAHISLRERGYEENIVNTLGTPMECFAYLLSKQRFNMSACFQIIKKTVLTDNHIEFVEGLRNEDIDWSLQLWRYLRSVKVVNLYAYIYRHRANSITTTLSIWDYQSYDYMYTKWKKILNPLVGEDFVYLQYLAYIYPTMVYGYLLLPAKDRKGAYEILQRHRDILNYSNTKKSGRIVMAMRCLGMRLCVWLFALYGYIKTKKKK